MIGLYVDPAKDLLKCACAIFENRKLEFVCFWSDIYRLSTIEVGAVVIEKPRVYSGPSKTDPNDLIDVAMTGREVDVRAGLLFGCRAEYVYPKAWKGSAKKPIHHRRVWRALSPQERVVVAVTIGLSEVGIEKKIDAACVSLLYSKRPKKYSWEAHNLLDAVGLGLWHTQRLGVAGVRRA